MYRCLCLVLFGLLLADTGYTKSAGSVPKYLSYSLASSSYGPLKIGMTVEQASAALGVKLLSGEDPSKPGFSQADHEACHFVTPEAKDIGLAFMVQNGVITRIDVSNKNIKTLNGLSIGSTAVDIKKRYGKSLRIEPHKSGTPMTSTLLPGSQVRMKLSLK